MIKWEYEFVINPTREFMDQIGQRGWELVAISGRDYVFKRAANFMEIQDELRKAWVESIKATFAELFNENDL